MASRKLKLAETARRNRVELVEAGLTRRDLFRMGLLTAGGYLVTKLGLSSRAAGALGAPASPPTTPWLEELPVPPVVAPVPASELGAAPAREPHAAAGELGRSGAHQHWELVDPANADHVVIENRVTPHVWHRELPADECWCFNGVFPGPRIHARRDRPVLVRVRNTLPSLADHVGYGRPTTSMHLHNGHTGSESDGHPLDVCPPGAFTDHLYLNRCAGFTDPRFGRGGDPRERVSTLWYHDRCIDFSAQNVYRGNAGLYAVFDALDTGDEHDASPLAWRLPSGAFDIPLVFHDRVFDSQGRGFFDLFDLDGVLGDTLTVNGRIRPFLRVAPRKYRFRALNVGPSRAYAFALSNGQPMTQITHDGNFLPAPLVVKGFPLPVGSRVDVIVDFSRLASGQEIYLVNGLEQRDGRGPTGSVLTPERATRVLKLVVDASIDREGDESRIPERFLDPPPVDLADVVTERTFVFDRAGGGWTINGRPLDPDEITASPRLGTAEIWNLVNAAGAGSLPVHIPLEEHQVLARNGSPPPAGEAARQDVVWLSPGETVKVFMRFRDFLGRYPARCDHAVHADQGLMFMWQVVA